MKTRVLTALLIFLGAGIMLSVTAGEQDPRDRIIEGLQQHLPDLPVEPEQLSQTPVEGLWVLKLGAEIVYVDETGEHLIQGDLIHLPSRDNLTEKSRSGARQEVLAEVSDDRRITYAAENERYSLTVFTDIDCGYCRQLHRDMEDINEAGITVHYLFYPRGGEDSAAWEKSDRVWCADDRHAAMDHAKSGGSPEAALCEDTPTEEHFRLGQQMRVTGTPALITDSGYMIRGYMPFERLVSEIRSIEDGERD